MQMPGAHRVAQRRLGQQPCGMVGILDVGNRHGRIRDAIVNDRVHRHGDTVFGQHLDERKQKKVSRV